MWAKSVTKLRSQNEWLLFFSVPKQLLLYQLIQECNEEELVYLLLKEVMFLVSNDPETREQLSEDIKVKEGGVYYTLVTYSYMYVLGFWVFNTPMGLHLMD